MTMFAGHPSTSPAWVPTAMGAPGGIPIGGPTNGPMARNNGTVVIDGTPIRVVIYALAAAAGLTALRMGGFKFNIGVSS